MSYLLKTKPTYHQYLKEQISKKKIGRLSRHFQKKESRWAMSKWRQEASLEIQKLIASSIREYLWNQTVKTVRTCPGAWNTLETKETVAHGSQVCKYVRIWENLVLNNNIKYIHRCQLCIMPRNPYIKLKVMNQFSTEQYTASPKNSTPQASLSSMMN